MAPSNITRSTTPLTFHWKEPKHGKKLEIIVVTSAALCLLVIIIVLSYLFWKWRQNAHQPPPEAAIQLADQAPSVNQGLTEAEIQAFPRRTSSAGEGGTSSDYECLICTEFFPGEQIVRLPSCGHEFCFKCVEGWMKTHPSCPFCREDYGGRGETEAV